MARLPAVLDSHDLPLPELMAARLDGEVIRFDRAWVPIDEPDLPSLRAAVLGKRVDRALIIERRSAAWVHGALIAPPDPPQFCVPHSARIASRGARDVAVREVVLDDGEVVSIGGVRCTTLLRTAFDLLRDDPAGRETAAAEAVAAVLAVGGPDFDEHVGERLEAAVRLPYKGRARARLSTARARLSTARELVDRANAAHD